MNIVICRTQSCLLHYEPYQTTNNYTKSPSQTKHRVTTIVVSELVMLFGNKLMGDRSIVSFVVICGGVGLLL